jgi:hypothetical protein
VGKIEEGTEVSPGRIGRVTGRREKRQDHEPPPAIDRYGWRYHHLGIPTKIRHENEKYLAEYKMYVSGFETNPFGVEWMRFETDSPVSDLVKNIPHLAFEVDDLDSAVAGEEVITFPMSISEKTRVAMIIYDGAPIELLEFRK